MAKLGAPTLNIVFKEAGATLIARGERGIVAMILKGEKDNTYTLRSITDIPDSQSETAENIQYMKDVFVGYQHAPKRVYVYVFKPEEGENETATKANLSDAYSKALKHFATERFQWLVAPYAEADGVNADIAAWVKEQRDKDHMVKAVLSNEAADAEGVVNWTSTLYKDSTAEDGTVTRTKYAPAKTTPRIAGLIAGTDLTISATYAPLSDFDDVDRLESDEINEHVNKGELIAFWDGEKVKLSRAVTSLVTTVQGKQESFQKIKLVEDMDLIKDDLQDTIRASYIGKFANSYDNKCLLMQAIKSYYDGLALDVIIEQGTIEINLEKQRIYLEGIGKDVTVNGVDKKPTELSDDEAKRANTGSHVFLKSHVTLLDAMEDIDIQITV